MNILLTGGAGYIGSVMTKTLLDAGHTVLVIDNLISGNKDSIDSRATFVQSDIVDLKKVMELFEQYTFNAVFHFAGVISMAESMRDPDKYFSENTMSTLHLLKQMKKHNVHHIIFSSTAGVYGNPEKQPIPEDHPTRPTNPYGESKLMIEQMLAWYDKIFGIRSGILRYFNAAGATRDGKIGERHTNETHIIPLAIKAVMDNQPFTLFGTDYNTPDGTCIRDYIHVEDLCQAHLLALNHIVNTNASTIYNVGTGVGYSNKQVLQEIEKVSGKKLQIVAAPRRAGDANILIADSTKIRHVLGWEPHYSDLKTIIETAWRFHSHENRH